MIKKMTSKELMNILEGSQSNIESLKKQAEGIRKSVEAQVNVVLNAQEFLSKELHAISEKATNGSFTKKSNVYVLHQIGEKYGNYNIYGVTTHPQFLSKPVNIFNLDTETGPIYKRNAIVRINEVAKGKYESMLIHDAIDDKAIAFEEFENPRLTLEVLAHPGEILGNVGFNVIEMLPHIPGSFTIDSIDIYTMQDYKTNNMLVPSYQITKSMAAAGPNRIIIDETLDLYKCVFNITLNHRNDAGKYPFGLQHLYFLKANMNMNSSVIIEIENDKFIQWVSEDITINDQFGKYKTTCTDEGIKLYMSYNNGVLNYEIATSKGLTQNIIPKNVHKIYAEIPLKKSITSIVFDHIEFR